MNEFIKYNYGPSVNVKMIYGQNSKEGTILFSSLLVRRRQTSI